MLKNISILGVPITQGDKREVLEEVLERLEKRSTPFYITTPNPEMVVLAQKHEAFKTALEGAGVALADGIGIIYASKLLSVSHIHRFTGVDFIEEVCKTISNQAKRGQKKLVSIGFLGGGPGVAEMTAKCLAEKYPGLTISFINDEWENAGFDNAHGFMLNSRKQFEADNNSDSDQRFKTSDQGDKDVEKKLRPQHIDILFVAFGFPKQELWMKEHIGNLPVSAMVGVGGAFDFISGKVTRAPVFLQSVGLEWLFRLVLQPWRIKRQLALPYFIFLVIKERFSRT